MSYGELISVVINIAVAIYFIHFYPKGVEKKLGQGRLPPLFQLLSKTLPIVGYLILVLTAAYLLVGVQQ